MCNVWTVVSFHQWCRLFIHSDYFFESLCFCWKTHWLRHSCYELTRVLKYQKIELYGERKIPFKCDFMDRWLSRWVTHPSLYSAGFLNASIIADYWRLWECPPPETAHFKTLPTYMRMFPTITQYKFVLLDASFIKQVFTPIYAMWAKLTTNNM